MRKMTVAVISAASVLTLGAAPDKETWEQQRVKATSRARTVMYYNGGDEVFRWSKGTPFSIDAFLKWHIAPLKDSEVDTVMYCSVSAFAYGSAKIPSVDPLFVQPDSSRWMANNTNVLAHFFEAGTDPLREVTKWCKANNKEVFASLSINSSHHGTDYDFAKPPPPYTWDNYLFPPFKVNHPEYLFGVPSGKGKGKPTINRPPFGSWSGLDYGEEDVRERCFEMARDLCAGYDIDGLTLDFMRDVQLFRSTAWGEKAGGTERKQMTEWLRRVRRSAEEIGVKRGRPILIAIRVPDSIPYCKDVGIDLETWMAEKLVDLVIGGGGGLQLNPWSYMTALCKKGGVKFYASLDESGIWIGNDRGGGEDDRLLPRQSVEAYRARVTDAMIAGANGVLFVNLHGESHIPREWMCASPERLKRKDKRYFVTYRNVGHAGHWLKEGLKYLNLPELCAYRPADIRNGGGNEYPISFWENLSELKAEGKPLPTLTLVTQAIIPQGMQLEVSLNKRKLELLKNASGYQRFAVPPGHIRFGINIVTLRASGRSDKKFHSTNTISVKNLALDVTFEEKKRAGDV